MIISKFASKTRLEGQPLRVRGAMGGPTPYAGALLAAVSSPPKGVPSGWLPERLWGWPQGPWPPLGGKYTLERLAGG